MDELTEDQKGLVATAIRYGQFPPKPEHLPDCLRLMDRGWFDRSRIGDEIVYGLSDRGVTALELGVPLAEAREATN